MVHPLENVQPSFPFRNYIEQGKSLASKVGIQWEIPLNADGVAQPGSAWDMRKLISDGRPTAAKLRNFSTFDKAMSEMRARGIPHSVEAQGISRPVSSHWQDLIKAYVIQQLLVAGQSIPHVTSTCSALRLIATVTNSKDPWTLTADDLDLCTSIAASIQPSGQSAIVIRSFVKRVLDGYHLVDAAPLLPLIGKNLFRQVAKIRVPKYLKKEAELKSTLQARKAEEKLPGMRAFWELMRIVFTEKPKTFYDAIRFAQGKLLTLTGLRIGEIALLPVDWRRTQEYRDMNGAPAGTHGGVSTSLLLRHFAEKQGSSRKHAGTLWENTQYIPRMFEDILSETLCEIDRLTAPLRTTLRAQCETGRLLPMYAPEQLVPLSELYLRMTGSVLTTDIGEDISAPYIDRYRSTYNLCELDALIALQRTIPVKPRMALYQFGIRLQKDGLSLRDVHGSPFVGRGALNAFLRTDEVEEYIRANTPTKVSDMEPFRLNNGELIQPWEMLFLLPKRALGDGRENLPCHVGNVIGIGVATQEILQLSLSSDKNSAPTLFQTYGETELDRNLTILPHSLRHLQNTELFRLGVADTIITKRFNRRSVAQSYEYDHRTLQEELEQITLPDEWGTYLGPKAGTVAKMIDAGRANGPIVREFKRLQATEGDDAAYSFLKAEADGFHATPYGHCLNSFTVDPCPTHLECFNGCMHLSATDLPENRKNLVRLEGKLRDALELARNKESTAIGRENQIRHAEIRLANVAKILQTVPGELVFQDGKDLSTTPKQRSVLDVP